jgi:hypothetical protein
VKTPPPLDDHVLPMLEVRSERDRRFLVFVALVLVAIALGFKSELIGDNQVWALGACLLVLAAPALLGYLRSDSGPPAVEHFVPLAVGAVAVAGLSLIVSEWWKYAVVAAAFGVGFLLAGQLDYRRLRSQEKPGHIVLQESVLVLILAGAYLVVLTVQLPLALRLAWVFAITLLATFRSFRVIGRPMPPRRALLFAVFVAQLLVFFAWAMSVYLNFQEGAFAAMLVFLWYMNRGIIRHTVEETLSRNVAIEYGLFGVLLAYLFFTSYQPR